MKRKTKNVLSQIGLRTSDSPISWLMKTKIERPNLVSLAAGFTDNESLPLSSSRRLLNELLENELIGRAALQYGTTAGDDSLRELTAKRIEHLDKSSNDKEMANIAKRMVITHGSQQFLYILTEALCDPGDIVLVEDPTYFVYLGIMQSRGLNGRGIAMNHDGIDLNHLEKVLESLRRSGELKRTKMLYLVSYYQNPTGRSTSLLIKKGALDLLKKYEKAAGHPIYLLEDAAYRELGFTGQPDSSVLSICDASERVIYSGTYSKPFATGVRVGFGVLPEDLLAPFLRIKSNHDFGTSHLIQKLVFRALDSGEYLKNLEKAQRRYQFKANVMHDAICNYFPEVVKWQKPDGGLNFWTELPRSMNTGLKSKFFEEALNQNVLYVPGNLCYVDDSTRRTPSNEMRLSFGAASEQEIRKGIKSLGNVIKCK